MSTPAITEQSLGKRGSTVIHAGSSTAQEEGNFAIIVAGPRGATLESITCSNKDNASELVGTFPAGYTSYGNFTKITVSSGQIEAYHA
jgi:hypothetical protein